MLFSVTYYYLWPIYVLRDKMFQDFYDILAVFCRTSLKRNAENVFLVPCRRLSVPLVFPCTRVSSNYSHRFSLLLDKHWCTLD